MISSHLTGRNFYQMQIDSRPIGQSLGNLWRINTGAFIFNELFFSTQNRTQSRSFPTTFTGFNNFLYQIAGGITNKWHSFDPERGHDQLSYFTIVDYVTFCIDNFGINEIFQNMISFVCFTFSKSGAHFCRSVGRI